MTILVRLLGAEEAATQKTIATPFTDVPAWAKPYVGYAYSKGYTNGVDAKHFGPNNTVSAAQFLTFLLRALGYKDGTDFTWDSPWTLTDRLGISNGAYNAKTKTFLRADAAALSASTLYAKKKGSDKTLLKDLLDNGAISGSTVVIWDYDAVAFQKDYASFLFYPVSGSPATFTSFKLDKVTVNGLSCQTLQVTTPEAVAAYLASIGHKTGGFGYVEITYDEEAAAKAATEYYTAANGKKYPSSPSPSPTPPPRPAASSRKAPSPTITILMHNAKRENNTPPAQSSQRPGRGRILPFCFIALPTYRGCLCLSSQRRRADSSPSYPANKPA
ncbi:MAG: S-layer homology domain-containing protein [Evtepia sp.]